MRFYVTLTCSSVNPSNVSAPTIIWNKWIPFEIQWSTKYINEIADSKVSIPVLAKQKQYNKNECGHITTIMNGSD